MSLTTHVLSEFVLPRLVFRLVWGDGGGIEGSESPAAPRILRGIEREVCDEACALLRLCYGADSRLRAAAGSRAHEQQKAGLMEEQRWRIHGCSKLAKAFETELVRKTTRAVAVATRLPHLPRRSAAQRLAEAERRREALRRRGAESGHGPRQRSEALRLRGLEAAARIDFRTALRCYSAALALEPRNVLALSNRSAVLCRLGEGAAALEDARTCIELAKDSAIGYVRAGYALIELGDLPHAQQRFEQAAALAPEDPRLAALAAEAGEQVERAEEEAVRSKERQARSAREAEARAQAKAKAKAQRKVQAKQRVEQDAAAAERQQEAKAREKEQRRAAHEARQAEEAQRRAERRAQREAEKAEWAEARAAKEEELARATALAERKRRAVQEATARMEAESQRQAEAERKATHEKWAAIQRERRLVDEERMRVLAQQRRERRAMEREHAKRKAAQGRAAAAVMALSARGAVSVPAEFQCPLSERLMVDPVTAADGYTYERKAIEGWVAEGQETSPMTGEPTALWLTPNHGLKARIEGWVAEQLQHGGGGATSRRGVAAQPELEPEPVPAPVPQRQALRRQQPEPEPEMHADEGAVDPISLVPLSELRHPPFDLPVDGPDGQHAELYDAQGDAHESLACTVWIPACVNQQLSSADTACCSQPARSARELPGLVRQLPPPDLAPSACP